MPTNEGGYAASFSHVIVKQARRGWGRTTNMQQYQKRYKPAPKCLVHNLFRLSNSLDSAVARFVGILTLTGLFDAAIDTLRL